MEGDKVGGNEGGVEEDILMDGDGCMEGSGSDSDRGGGADVSTSGHGAGGGTGFVFP